MRGAWRQNGAPMHCSFAAKAMLTPLDVVPSAVEPSKSSRFLCLHTTPCRRRWFIPFQLSFNVFQIKFKLISTTFESNFTFSLQVVRLNVYFSKNSSMSKSAIQRKLETSSKLCKPSTPIIMWCKYRIIKLSDTTLQCDEELQHNTNYSKYHKWK